MSEVKTTRVLNLPNIITFVRFALSLVIFALLPMGEYLISLILFIK